MIGIGVPPGTSFWDCYYQSHSPLIGTVLHGLFLMCVMLVLVNVLIAMMADTYADVAGKSFMNYVFGFAKVTLEWQACVGMCL